MGLDCEGLLTRMTSNSSQPDMNRGSKILKSHISDVFSPTIFFCSILRLHAVSKSASFPFQLSNQNAQQFNGGFHFLISSMGLNKSVCSHNKMYYFHIINCLAAATFG